MSPTFPQKELAAYFLAKVYYYMEDFESSMEYILESGPHFDITKRDGFTDCLLAKCIDKYIALRKQKDMEGLSQNNVNELVSFNKGHSINYKNKKK